MSNPNDPLKRKFSVELTGMEYAVLLAALRLHNKNPVMSSKDTDVLVGLETSLDRQLG